MSDDKSITLMTNAISFSTAESPRRLKASAMPHKPAEILTDFRQRWRPKVGPGKEIPQKFAEVETTEKNFEELEKKRVEKILAAWRPAVGPVSAI